MNFWQTKTLAEMSAEEWESLCDHCGKCCLHKLEDEGTGQIAYTRIACKLLDLKTCRCNKYQERTRYVPECMDLRKHDFVQFKWLPTTCAYRLLNEGEPLPVWHPLVSGTSKSVQAAGIQVSRYALTESPDYDLEDHIIEWLD